MSNVTIEHDLRMSFGPARDQGPRPTCLAFAVSDTHAAIRGNWVPLSCEFLYYHAIQRDGFDPKHGATIASLLAALRHEGQPSEAGWPYLLTLPPDNALWQPPLNVGTIFRRQSDSSGTSFDNAWSIVTAQQPATIVFTLSDAFYLPMNGFVDAVEPLDPTRLHAAVAVAAGRRGRSRFLMIRNSWGPGWGLNGHAWIAERYLAPRMSRVLALKEVA
jgi:hypothetical protein